MTSDSNPDDIVFGGRYFSANRCDAWKSGDSARIPIASSARLGAEPTVWAAVRGGDGGREKDDVNGRESDAEAESRLAERVSEFVFPRMGGREEKTRE